MLKNVSDLIVRCARVGLAVGVAGVMLASEALSQGLPGTDTTLPPSTGGTPEPTMLAIGGVAAGAYWVFRKARGRRQQS